MLRLAFLLGRKPENPLRSYSVHVLISTSFKQLSKVTVINFICYRTSIIESVESNLAFALALPY